MNKDKLIKAKADLDEANGLAQSAINGLSGVLPADVYKPFYDVLTSLQPGTAGPGTINTLSRKLQELIDSTPNGE